MVDIIRCVYKKRSIPMKFFTMLLLLLIVLGGITSNAQVINNSPSSQVAADSLPMAFYNLDSAGNVVSMASGDSVFLAVFDPSGVVVWKDSLAYNGANITAQTLSTYTVYAWAEAGAVLDGTTPRNGVYAYVIIVKDLTGASIGTPITGNFQLYLTQDYDEALDLASDTSLYASEQQLLDSIRWAQGVGIGSFSFALRTADIDSLFYGSDNDTTFIKIYYDKLTGNVKTKVVAYSDR